MDFSELMRRIQEEAQPPVVVGRLPCPDLAMETLLDDLTQSHAWLARELKESLLELWVNDDSVFVNPDLQDPIVIVDYANLFAFAAMDPVVDLESLRGVHTVT
jgi:hypothetical protein